MEKKKWIKEIYTPTEVALINLYELIVEGELIRNIKDDGDEGWHLRMIMMTHRLGKASKIVEELRGRGK